MTGLDLDQRDQSMLSGHHGEAMQFAMEIVVKAARIMHASHLIDTSFVHVDACHYYGRAHVDFAQYFVDHGLSFDIPAWTNTVPVSLKQDEIRDGADPVALSEARQLADLYVALGCEPLWTCAPYQLPGGPAFGDQIVGSESNAVAYYNSVVGARTNKYGDFLDVCAGLTGRVPNAGLHRTEGRRGSMLFDISGIDEAIRTSEMFCHVLGHFIGAHAYDAIPVIAGLPSDTHVDSLKAISAAVAASGGVAMFHAIGVTPEADSADAAFQGLAPRSRTEVSHKMICQARDSLSTGNSNGLNMVALGTPHFSFSEFKRLADALDGRSVHADVTFYVSTARHIADLVLMHDWGRQLQASGIDIVIDTCTYFSPAVRACRGRVMTNSAKWAYYAPGMLDVDVAFGSLGDCVESAVHGEVRRDNDAWTRRTQVTVP